MGRKKMTTLERSGRVRGSGKEDWDPVIKDVLLPFINQFVEEYPALEDMSGLDFNGKLLDKALGYYLDHARRFGIDLETWVPLVEPTYTRTVDTMRQALTETHRAFEAYEALPNPRKGGVSNGERERQDYH